MICVKGIIVAGVCRVDETLAITGGIERSWKGVKKGQGGALAKFLERAAG